MSFVLDAEQLQFAEALHDQLAAADVPAVARQWAAGDRKRGQALWYSLAEAGVAALAVPQQWDGLGAHPADLVIACEELGHHAMPGPIAESLAAVPKLLASLAASDAGLAAEAAAADQGGRPPLAPRQERIDGWLRQLAAGELIGTLAWPPLLPYAADAELAGLVLLAGQDSVQLAEVSSAQRSVHAGRLVCAVAGNEPLAAGPAAAHAVQQAFEFGALASAAQLLGAGRALLDCAAAHAAQRTQFGSPVGSFQAVKHQLANVLIALEFARPLLFAAAVALADDPAGAPRDVSAAKVACTDAARLAARVALQVHGAIGYTAEHDLSLWLTLVRAVSPAWGSQRWHRARVLAALAGPASRADEAGGA